MFCKRSKNSRMIIFVWHESLCCCHLQRKLIFFQEQNSFWFLWSKMLGSFSSLKSVLKFKRVKIDATIFRLSYKFSVTLMIASSILVTSRQFFGDPIDCVHTHDIPKSVLNTYCWIHSTYTIPSAFWKRIAIDVPHPGIDKTVDPDERRYVKYYQWVVFCLSFQVRIKWLRCLK